MWQVTHDEHAGVDHVAHGTLAVVVGAMNVNADDNQIHCESGLGTRSSRANLRIIACLLQLSCQPGEELYQTGTTSN